MARCHQAVRGVDIERRTEVRADVTEHGEDDVGVWSFEACRRKPNVLRTEVVKGLVEDAAWHAARERARSYARCASTDRPIVGRAGGRAGEQNEFASEVSGQVEQGRVSESSRAGRERNE